MPLLDDNLIPLEIYEKIFKAGYRGTFLGGCIERKEGSSIRRSAHCHCFPKDPYFGYICMKSRKPEKCIKDGKLTNLFKHELGHLLARGDYGKKLCKALIELGYKKSKYDHSYIEKNLSKVRKELRSE